LLRLVLGMERRGIAPVPAVVEGIGIFTCSLWCRGGVSSMRVTPSLVLPLRRPRVTPWIACPLLLQLGLVGLGLALCSSLLAPLLLLLSWFLASAGLERGTSGHCPVLHAFWFTCPPTHHILYNSYHPLYGDLRKRDKRFYL
jgi:hypothetical protein